MIQRRLYGSAEYQTLKEREVQIIVQIHPPLPLTLLLLSARLTGGAIAVESATPTGGSGQASQQQAQPQIRNKYSCWIDWTYCT